MAKIIGCSLIIRDDFRNVLVLNKKVKRGEVEIWSLLSQKLKGKESHDKCITRAAKDILKSVIFDVEPVKEYMIDSSEDECVMVYTGRIKEKAILDKTYKECRWISYRNLEDLNMASHEKQILSDFFQE